MLIVLVPIMLASTVAAVFTVTGGGSFVLAAVAWSEYQRWQGHKGREGRLSEREAGSYFSTSFDKNSEHSLSISLGLLASAFPMLFEPFTGKKYDFTKSEGELLRAMIHPAVISVSQIEGIKIQLEEDPGNEDLQAILFATLDNASTLVAPIVVFLEQFPKQRVKKVS